MLTFSNMARTSELSCLAMAAVRLPGSSWRSTGEHEHAVKCGIGEKLVEQRPLVLGADEVDALLDAFAAARDDRPTLFIAYTIKGFGLPLQGHKDNHAGLMSPEQTRATVVFPAPFIPANTTETG